MSGDDLRVTSAHLAELTAQQMSGVVSAIVAARDGRVRP